MLQVWSLDTLTCPASFPGRIAISNFSRGRPSGIRDGQIQQAAGRQKEDIKCPPNPKFPFRGLPNCRQLSLGSRRRDVLTQDFLAGIRRPPRNGRARTIPRYLVAVNRRIPPTSMPFRNFPARRRSGMQFGKQRTFFGDRGLHPSCIARTMANQLIEGPQSSFQGRLGFAP